MDVAKVDQDACYTCCNKHTRMLQAFVQKCFIIFFTYVTSFYLDVAYVFTRMLQAFVRNVSSLSDDIASVLSGYLHMFQTYVVAFFFVLQVFSCLSVEQAHNTEKYWVQTTQSRKPFLKPYLQVFQKL